MEICLIHCYQHGRHLSRDTYQTLNHNIGTRALINLWKCTYKHIYLQYLEVFKNQAPSYRPQIVRLLQGHPRKRNPPSMYTNRHICCCSTQPPVGWRFPSALRGRLQSGTPNGDAAAVGPENHPESLLPFSTPEYQETTRSWGISSMLSLS